jgi:hypothetical protein
MAFSPARHALSRQGRGRARRPARLPCVVDASSHRSTAALARSHVRSTFHPGRSPRWKRSFTMSAETVRHWAVRWTSSTSGKRVPVSSVDACVMVMA